MYVCIYACMFAILWVESCKSVFWYFGYNERKGARQLLHSPFGSRRLYSRIYCNTLIQPFHTLTHTNSHTHRHVECSPSLWYNPAVILASQNAKSFDATPALTHTPHPLLGISSHQIHTHIHTHTYTYTHICTLTCQICGIKKSHFFYAPKTLRPLFAHRPTTIIIVWVRGI